METEATSDFLMAFPLTFLVGNLQREKSKEDCVAWVNLHKSRILTQSFCACTALAVCIPPYTLPDLRNTYKHPPQPMLYPHIPSPSLHLMHPPLFELHCLAPSLTPFPLNISGTSSHPPRLSQDISCTPHSLAHLEQPLPASSPCTCNLLLASSLTLLVRS